MFIGYFPQKNPIINGSFAAKDLQFEAFYASAPTCSSKRIIYHLQVSFRKRATNHKVFLREMTYKDQNMSSIS